MTTTTSFYVHRIQDDGRNGWVGPIRSSRQADKEVAAWQECGWQAWKHEASAEVRAAVKAWQAQVKRNRAA